MKKSSVLILCILLSWISVCTSCSDGQECPKFKKKEPRKKSCNCNNNTNNNSNNNNIDKPKPNHDVSNDEPEDDSCNPFKPPPVPNFSRPGQRISITKCHEYIWQIRVRVQRADQERKCKESKSKIKVIKREVNMNVSLETSLSDPVVPHPEQNIGKTLYIMGGKDAFPKEFPHMGAIGWSSSDPNRDWKFMCGCTLISPKFALTAAHCSSADRRDTTIRDVIPKIVRFGVEDIATAKSAVDRNISKVIVHPQYRSPIKYYDIALLELDRPITFNKFVQPACLWTEEIDKVKEGTVTGWGVTNPDAHEGHPYLQVATLDVIDEKQCEDLLWQYHNRRWRGLQDHQFCAGQLNGGVDSCQGDSGGPFQMKIPLPPQVARKEGNLHYLVGVTSFGISCGKKDLPGVYSKVSRFLDWIEPIVWA